MSSCDCGSSCMCGDSCSCGKMYPDVEKATTGITIIQGVAPVKRFREGPAETFGTEGGHGCKCGSNCQCDPCNC